VNVRRKLAAAVLFLLVVGLAALLPAVARAAEQPTLTLAAAPSALTCGATTTLTAQGSPPGAELTLSRKRAGETEFTVVAAAIADSDGDAQWKRTPGMSTVFQVAFTDAAAYGSASAEVSVGVRPRVTLAAAARKPLLEDRYVRYTVKVRPAHPGGTVQLTRRTAGGWVALQDVTLGDDSQATVRVLAGKPGRLVVRAEMPADADHLSGHSPLWRVTVYDKRNPYGTPTRLPHLILVDLSKYKLYYHEHGNIVRVFDCVLGRPSLPTPKGHYKIYAKDPHMGGPYGPFRMRYLGLYAIHGTNEPWLLDRFPRNYSHGCTRLANANITWLYSRVHVGTPVWNVP
jgi:lipoprotein-anchoring transpeptidase ErfK/SrfK